MTLVSDAFTRADGALVGSAFSDGSGLVWGAGSGAPAISGNRLDGTPGFAVVNLRGANNTVSAFLQSGGKLVFRYVDANNYWLLTSDIWSGANADTPPIYSYGYRWVIEKFVGGSLTGTWTFNGNTDYLEWGGHTGYPLGAYDPGHLVTVTLSGSSITIAAEGGQPSTGGVVTTNFGITDSTHATATRFGIGGPGDNFAGNFVQTAPTTPTLTAPNGGETIDASTPVTWTAFSVAEGDAVVYDLVYTIDNGTTWTGITSGVSGTSYTWNTTAVGFTTTGRVRVRARDALGATSSYDESNGNFTIQHTPYVPAVMP